MDEEYLERIAAFLRQYIELPTGEPLPAEEVYLKDGIAILMQSGVMDKNTIRLEALRNFSVFIDDSFFEGGASSETTDL